eukprot:9803799-Lingulodinium_polyedra.AAC.1
MHCNAKQCCCAVMCCAVLCCVVLCCGHPGRNKPLGSRLRQGENKAGARWKKYRGRAAVALVHGPARMALRRGQDVAPG